MSSVTVTRSALVLHPDRRRVLARPFRPPSRQRGAKICAQVMALPEAAVHTLLKQVEAEFGVKGDVAILFGDAPPQLFTIDSRDAWRVCAHRFLLRT